MSAVPLTPGPLTPGPLTAGARARRPFGGLDPLAADPARDALALVGCEEMAACDRFAIAAGTPGVDLMARAGAAVAEAIQARWTPRPTLILCGPGNNGGDGYVVARLLRVAGWPVRVAALGREGLSGDAAWAAAGWTGPVEGLDSNVVGDAELMVDALFGAGLTRPVTGGAAQALAAVADRGVPICAVDVPSGLDGDSGLIRGFAVSAALTVTFFRPKPGHLLQPGRALCGELVVADIGIPAAALAAVGPRAWRNDPTLWWGALRRPGPTDHKYSRGAVLILGGAPMTGAARLAAAGARRAGAGLTAIACAPEAWSVYAADAPGVVLSTAPFAEQVADRRWSALLVGPGAGVSAATRAAALAALAGGKPTLLDADALTAFAGAGDQLRRAIAGPVLLTPHEGEFARLFPQFADSGDNGGGKLARARAAAAWIGATVLLKGSDAVVAHPDGRAVILGDDAFNLATAGSGDCLAGLAAALLAGGAEPLEAAAAAAWLHAAAARAGGFGLIAEDLPTLAARAMAKLLG